MEDQIVDGATPQPPTQEQESLPKADIAVLANIEVPCFFSVQELTRQVFLGTERLTEEEDEKVKDWLKKYISILQQSGVPLTQRTQQLMPTARTFLELKFFYRWPIAQTGEWLMKQLNISIQPHLSLKQPPAGQQVAPPPTPQIESPTQEGTPYVEGTDPIETD